MDFTIGFVIPQGRFAGYSLAFDVSALTEDEILYSASAQMEQAGLLNPVETSEGSGEYESYELNCDEFNSLFKAKPSSPLWEELGFDLTADLEDWVNSAKEIKDVMARYPGALEVWQASVRVHPPGDRIDSIDFDAHYMGRFNSLQHYATDTIESYSLLTDIPKAILCTFNHEVAAQFLMRHSVFDPQTGCVFSD